MNDIVNDNANVSIFGGSIPERVLKLGEWNDSNLNFFTRYDGPFSQREVVIGNHALRKILKKNFEYMSRNLFFVSSFGRFLLGSEKMEAVLEAEKISDRTIQNAMEAINRRFEWAKALLTANQIEESAQNGKAQVMLVPMTSPGARAYIELLVQADAFYNLNALLWIEGKIDSHHKFQNESAVRKEVQGAVRGIANQFAFILNLTRRKDPKEAEKVGEHDEAALAAAAESQVGELGQAAVTDSVSKPDSEEPPAAGEVAPKKRKSAKATEAVPA